MFSAVSVGMSPSPISSKIESTTIIRSGAFFWAESTTRRISDASASSSSVARKAATSAGGSLWMNPTVSVSSAARPDGRRIRRVTGSSVENMRFSARTPARVSRLSSVLLPALVYPTSEMTGMSPDARLARRSPRWRRTPASSFLSRRMRSRAKRLSVSICVSPGPRVPMPPPSRSRCVHCPASRGSRYSCWASSTCSRPSRVRARDANTSRISAARSITLRPPSASSRLRCWVGVSSSSHMTVSALSSSQTRLRSSSLPLPRYV